jgi:hypothetical protein
MTMDEWLRILRQAVAPVAGAYLVVVAMLLRYWRDQRAGSAPPSRARHFHAVRGGGEWLALFRYVLVTAAGGYVVFLLIVVTFYFVLGGEDRNFIVEALREGSVLTFAMVVPTFLLITWLYGFVGRGDRRRRPLTSPGGRGAQPGGRNTPA